MKYTDVGFRAVYNHFCAFMLDDCIKVFTVKRFSPKKASFFPFFIKGNSSLSAGSYKRCSPVSKPDCVHSGGGMILRPAPV